MKKFEDIDDKTAELIAKLASELFKHDYPLCDNHVQASHIKYGYRASVIYKKALKVIK